MKNLTKFVKIPSLVTVRRGRSNLYSPKSLATDVQLRVRERLFKGVYSALEARANRERSSNEPRRTENEQRETSDFLLPLLPANAILLSPDRRGENSPHRTRAQLCAVY